IRIRVNELGSAFVTAEKDGGVEVVKVIRVTNN
ncbi:hypothetical protein Tco_1339132, partial [Tanacetum coccineum]